MPNTNSHHEEKDGSDHGHTGKPARPDPQLEHGQDCEVHGQYGGVNEDHCSTTSTTTTTTTAPSSSTTTGTNTPPSQSGSSSSLPENTGPGNANPVPTIPTPSTSQPSLGCTTPDGFPYLTNIEQGGCTTVAVPEVPIAPALPRPELAATGGLTLLPVGVALVLAGLVARLAGRRR